MNIAQGTTDTKPFQFLKPEWLKKIDSTSEEIRRRLSGSPGPPSGTVIATHLQTRGKGRMGRIWQSAAVADLTFSFLWIGDAPLERIATFPLACGLAVRDFLLIHGITSRCKWPNDIMVDGAKICGILAESLPAASKGFRLIMGIGVNLANDPKRNELVEQPVAAMSQITGKSYNPVDILPDLLDMLAKRIETWRTAGFPGIRNDLRDCLWGVGREVGVRAGKNGEKIIRGRIDSLGNNGELILLGKDNQLFPVVSASALDI